MIQIILWILFYLVGWVAVIVLMRLDGTDIKAIYNSRNEPQKIVGLFLILLSWAAVSTVVLIYSITYCIKFLYWIIIKIDQLLGATNDSH